MIRTSILGCIAVSVQLSCHPAPVVPDGSPSRAPRAAAPVTTEVAPAAPFAQGWVVELEREDATPAPRNCAASDEDCIVDWTMNHQVHIYRLKVSHDGRQLPTREWLVNDDAMWEEPWNLEVIHHTGHFAIAEVRTGSVYSECEMMRVFALKISDEGIETLWDDELHWEEVEVKADDRGVVVRGTHCDNDSLSDRPGQKQQCTYGVGYDFDRDEDCEAWFAPVPERTIVERALLARPSGQN